MATNVQDTQELITVVQANPAPGLMNTQELICLVVRGSVFSVAPSSFNLQKLVLTVKESNIPARGRNQ